MARGVGSLEEVAANRCFGGWHRRFRHYSPALRCDMVFAVYLPPQAADHKVPALYWLSGLTCTDENFMPLYTGAGSQGARCCVQTSVELFQDCTAPSSESPQGPLAPHPPQCTACGHFSGAVPLSLTVSTMHS